MHWVGELVIHSVVLPKANVVRPENKLLVMHSK